jgi:dynein heavy chain
LKKGHVGEMKNLGSPPDGVKLTGRIILILLGERITLNDPDEKVWKKCVGAMNNPGAFLDKIPGFDGENIDQGILDMVNKVK